MGSREEMLMRLVHNEDYEAVQTLLKSKVNINYQNNEGITPLLGATEKGDYKMTKLLLDHGADCNGRGRLTGLHHLLDFRLEHVLEWTPLVNAALYGHSDIVQLLIENGADINFRDINGRSALHAALQRCNQKCAEILIRNGAEVSPLDFATASVACPQISIEKFLNEREKSKKTETKNHSLRSMHLAASRGDREELRLLIKEGADINRKDKTGNTALHVALENGKFACAELLIKKGADVNIQGKNKSTPLHIAASLGLTKIIPYLVGKGAIIDARGDDEITPLHFAVFHSFPICVRQLLDYGASVNATFADGKTALHVAVSKSFDCIELLMKEKADIFAKDDLGICPLELAIELGIDTFRKLISGNYNISSSDGTTPLHIAAHCCRVDCLQKMIEDDCDVSITTNNGDTPLHFACNGGVAVCSVPQQLTEEQGSLNVEMLIQAGADIHKKNLEGMSPIHVGAINGLVAPLRALLKAGAEINSQGGGKNQTPLHYASESGCLACIKFLVEKGADKTAVNSDNFTALMLAARNGHFSCVKFLLQNDVPLWIV